MKDAVVRAAAVPDAVVLAEALSVIRGDNHERIPKLIALFESIDSSRLVQVEARQEFLGDSVVPGSGASSRQTL